VSKHFRDHADSEYDRGSALTLPRLRHVSHVWIDNKGAEFIGNKQTNSLTHKQTFNFFYISTDVHERTGYEMLQSGCGRMSHLALWIHNYIVSSVGAGKVRKVTLPFNYASVTVRAWERKEPSPVAHLVQPTCGGHHPWNWNDL